MTELATPVPTPLPPAPDSPAVPATSASTPVGRRAGWRRLTAAVAEAHRAAVPF